MLYTIVSLGFLLLLLIILHGSRNQLKKSSSSSTSPPSYPIIGCLISFYRNRNNLLDWYTHLLSESPTKTIVIRRLGARLTIVTADPTNVEYILRANFGNYPKGRAFTEIVGDFLGNGIFNVDGEVWSSQRKLASHEFSSKALREFVVQILEDEVKNRLLPLLEDFCVVTDDKDDPPRVLDLQEILGRFSFDTICRVSLGTDPRCLDLSRPLPTFVTAFDVASKTCAMRGSAPMSLLWKLKRALKIGSEKELARAVKTVHQAGQDIIQTKKRQLQQENETNNRGDLLTRLLVSGHGDDLVRDMVISFIMAGRDTTSAAMTWLFWLPSHHPDIEKQIVTEAEFFLKDGTVLDFEALRKMKFLKACLCESMRLYPPVAWDSKHAAAHDVLPDGTPVRKGDRVTYFPYGMGRMENLWGKDRLEFKPERWFNGGELKMVSPFEFPVFQAGPRVCLGKEMAFLQMKYVVASVLRRFEMRPVWDEKPIFVPLLTAHMDGGFKVVVRKRTTNEPMTTTGIHG